MTTAPGVRVALILPVSLAAAGREGENASATLAAVSAIGKAECTAGTGNLLGADGFRTDLTGEIHFHQRIDGHHVILLCNNHRVIGVTTTAHQDTGMVVQIFIGKVVRNDEGTDRPALVQVFYTGW